MSVVGFYFGWPDGAIYSNLLASLLCVGLAWWRLHAQALAHHLEQMAQRERHHAELQAHITATVTAAARPPKRLAARTPQRPGGNPDHAL